jgi:FkbM family methyltransferase
LLNCESLFNASSTNSNNDNGNYRRRRLEEFQHGDDGGFADAKERSNDGGEWGEGGDGGEWGEGGDGGDWGGGGEQPLQNDDMYNNKGDWGDQNYAGYYNDEQVTAKHLFCAAALQTPPSAITSELKCDAAGTKRQTLLDLWSAARAQMPEPLLLKILGLAKEHTDQNLLGKDYNLWAPSNDDGLSYMLNSLNLENTVDHGGLHGLHENLGKGKLFVDVGSCLGITTLAVINLYPGTKIVSMEPASPNWLLQELNLRCNLEHVELLNIHVVLAGVGPNSPEEDNMMAKLMWRPTATTSTRAWTPATEIGVDNVELVVRLRRLNSILAEADVYGIPIDVLNVDCEGCEYNLLPALSEEEFEAIPTVMGGVHWGYIPTTKLPSSTRGKTTHERLCQHENIARTAKECCAFPKLEVKSSVPGEILVREQDNKSITVADVAGDLCLDFAQWALDHYLYDVRNDWGWMELTSQA